MAYQVTRESAFSLISNVSIDYQEYHEDSALISFLQKEDLMDLKTPLNSLNINLSYLKHLKHTQLNELCDTLQLKPSSAARLQFMNAVKRIQTEYINIKKQSISKSINKNNHHSFKQNISNKSTTTFTKLQQSTRPNHGYDFLIKVILLGDTCVGKSCLLLRYVDDTFNEQSHAITTIGIDYRMKTVELGDDTIKFQIWDTAGQERYRTIVSAYYRRSDAVLLVYDITNKQSFLNIYEWIDDVRNHCDDTFMMLVGTKLDKADERDITHDQGQRLADEMGIKFCEVSAKSGHGINSLFFTVGAYAILAKKKQNESIIKTRARTQEKIIRLTNEQHLLDKRKSRQKLKKNCCQ